MTLRSVVHCHRKREYTCVLDCFSFVEILATIKLYYSIQMIIVMRQRQPYFHLNTVDHVRRNWILSLSCIWMPTVLCCVCWLVSSTITVGIWITNIWIKETPEKQTFTCPVKYHPTIWQQKTFNQMYTRLVIFSTLLEWEWNEREIWCALASQHRHLIV